MNVISQDGYTTAIHFYDMFCGEGIYDDDRKGSPVIALDAIKSHYGSMGDKMPNIKMTLNDIDEDVIAKLKPTINKYYKPDKCEIRFLNDDYLKLFPVIKKELKALQNEKAVVFLDPKGYKEISISHINELMIGGKTEVIVFLPIRDMYRFSNMTADQIQAAHEPLYKLITEIFPGALPRFDSQLDFIYKIKGSLKKLLPHLFIDTFTLEREPGQFFCLFFFTSHIKGFEKMLETKWELDEEQGRGWKYERTEALFTGTESSNFPKHLEEYIQEKKRYNCDVYQYSLHEGYLPKHTNDVLRKLQQTDVIKVMESNSKEARKNAFYINYDCYKDEPQKVFFTVNLRLF